MIGDIRIATVVCRCPVGELKRNLERTAEWTLKAKKKGAGLICFPELNLTGYSNRHEIIEHAITANGPEFEALVDLAKEQQIVLLVGFAELGTNGALYASHMVITPQGQTGIYRKLHLAPPEQALYTAGNTVPLFKVGDATCGIQLCYDAHFPELTARMALDGADVVFIPHASPSRGQTARDKHQSWMRHLTARAYDNGLFIVACNQTGDNQNGGRAARNR